MIFIASGVYLFQLILSRIQPHEPSIRELVTSSVFALTLTVAIWMFVWLGYGSRFATSLIAEYLTQYTLSVDVLFVVAVTLSLFAVPRVYQDALLAFAAILALVIRTVLIGAGAVLTSRFSWVVFVSGALVRSPVA